MALCQGLGRQRGEDVVEGGDCGQRCSAACSGSSRTHCLELLLGEQWRRTGRTRSHLGSRRDGQRRRSPERCSAGSACPGHGGTRAPRPDTRAGCAAAAPPLARCVAQRVQCAGTLGRGSAPRRRRRSVRTRRSPWAGRGGASAPSLRARGRQPRVSRRAPVRRAVAGPDKARDIHVTSPPESHGISHAGDLDVLRQPPQAQPQHPRGQVVHLGQASG